MDLHVQRRLASQVIGCSQKRVRFDTANLSRIKEAITKVDVRSLVNEGLIKSVPVRGVSRVRIRHRLVQKRKGRVQGHGSRKGVATARLPRKQRWMASIRLQRRVLRELRDTKKITPVQFREMYLKCKGGAFRSRAHLMLYLDEHKMIKGGNNE